MTQCGTCKKLLATQFWLWGKDGNERLGVYWAFCDSCGYDPRSNKKPYGTRVSENEYLASQVVLS